MDSYMIIDLEFVFYKGTIMLQTQILYCIT